MAIQGTLLICPQCGDSVELLGARPKAEHIQANPEDYLCDCGALLALADDEADRRAERRALTAFVLPGG